MILVWGIFFQSHSNGNGDILVNPFSYLLLPEKQLLLESLFFKKEKLPFIEHLPCARPYAKGSQA